MGWALPRSISRFLFLYLYAYRLRDALELSELERFDTRYQMCKLLILIGVGLLAAGLAGCASFYNGVGLLISFSCHSCGSHE